MTTYNPDDPGNQYPLGKMLFVAAIKAKASWADDIDHVENLWVLSDWKTKADYQRTAENFLGDVGAIRR